MHAEIAAAVSSIASLLQAPPVSQKDFRADLHLSLTATYSSMWYPSDPERASASRVLHWQPGPGGEGCSSLLIDACKKHKTSLGDREWTMWIDPACVAIRMGSGPGRLNHSISSNLGCRRSSSFHESIRIIFGEPTCSRIIAPPNETMSLPLITFASSESKAVVISRPGDVYAGSAAVPVVAESPSTPAIATIDTPDTTLVVPWNKSDGASTLHYQLALRFRRRSDSSASEVSSSNISRRDSVTSEAFSSLSMGRGGSLEAASSIGTSIPASSPPTSVSWSNAEFKKDDEDAEQRSVGGAQDKPIEAADGDKGLKFRDEDEISSNILRSLVRESSLVGTELHDLGLEVCGLDEIEVRPEDAISAAGCDDEYQNEEALNDTDVEGDDTILPLNGGDDIICPMEAIEAKHTSYRASRRSSVPTSSVASFDNGNVGVLGGGVKLGGSSASSAASRPRSRAHSATSSVSNFSACSASGRSVCHQKTRSVMSLTGGWAAQQQSHLQQKQQQQQQQVIYPPNGLGLSNMQASAASWRSRDYQAFLHIFDTGVTDGHQKPCSLKQMQSPLPTEASHLQIQPLSKRRDATFPPLSLSQKPNAQHLLSNLDTPKSGNFLPLPSLALSSSSSLQADGGERVDNGEEQKNVLEQSAAGKRTRSRGRRSRGRGAGRAARRAAAAAAAAAANEFSPAMASPAWAMGHWPRHQLHLQRSLNFSGLLATAPLPRESEMGQTRHAYFPTHRCVPQSTAVSMPQSQYHHTQN